MYNLSSPLKNLLYDCGLGSGVLRQINQTHPGPVLLKNYKGPLGLDVGTLCDGSDLWVSTKKVNSPPFGMKEDFVDHTSRSAYT